VDTQTTLTGELVTTHGILEETVVVDLVDVVDLHLMELHTQEVHKVDVQDHHVEDLSQVVFHVEEEVEEVGLI
jgi:hypothetical protein